MAPALGIRVIGEFASDVAASQRLSDIEKAELPKFCATFPRLAKATTVLQLEFLSLGQT